MRSGQFGGLPILIHNNRMYNCGYAPIDNIATFWETMFLLLGGTGMGYSVQRRHIDQLPALNQPSARRVTHVIPDSIEGWSDAIKWLFQSYFNPVRQLYPVFDYSEIRPKGARLVTSGGKAPG